MCLAPLGLVHPHNFNHNQKSRESLWYRQTHHPPQANQENKKQSPWHYTVMPFLVSDHHLISTGPNPRSKRISYLFSSSLASTKERKDKTLLTYRVSFAFIHSSRSHPSVRIFAKVPYPLPLPRPWITYYNGCLNKGSYVSESVAENVS